jgi:hypothetical protein
MLKAGFRKIDIQNVIFKRKRDIPEKFVTDEDYADLDPETRSAVVADIRKAMEPFRTGDGTEVPYGSHIAIGYK